MKTVNGLTVYEGTDKAALDEYSEKMAEEIPKKIKESNYDDTEIKEDIQDIKSEQTTQNTKLQELEDNQIHITTERASNLNVQDASGQNAKINIFGISKQETRSGKNKFDVTKLENVENIDSKTGSFAIKAYGTWIMAEENVSKLLKPNTQYKCYVCYTLILCVRF